MRKIITIITLIAFLLISGCSKETKTEESEPQFGIYDIQSCENSVKFWVKDELRENPDLDVEQYRNEVLNTYCGEETLENARVLIENGYKTFVEHTWNNVFHSGQYMTSLRPATEWIKDNIEEDAKIISWWDYGDMIRAISQRDAVLFGPSKEFVAEFKSNNPEWKPNFKEEDYVEHELLVDVANILLTQNAQTAIGLMNKYNAKYLLVTTRDIQISLAINKWVSGDYELPSENAVFFLALNKNLDEFDLLYSDDYSVIYKIK